MFRLHDRTRRRLCIAGFFVFCIAPTALISAWGVARHWPGYVQSEVRRLSGQLGLAVSLDGLRYLRPGVVRYEGLQLADAETGQPLLQCRALEATWTDLPDARGRRKPALLLVASQPQVEAAGLDRLGSLVERLLQRQGGGQEVDVRLAAVDVTLRTGERAETLRAVQGGNERLAGGAQAQVEFRPTVLRMVPGVEMPEPARIRVGRNRQITPPASLFELDTGGGALPCGLLGLGLAELSSLGPQCRFRGYLWANQCPQAADPDAWEGGAIGEFLDLDLDKLLGERFPHRLTGLARVSIQSARFRQGRLEEATATLTAGPGMIGRSLVDAAVANLRLLRGLSRVSGHHANGMVGETGTVPFPAGELMPYEQLALALRLDADGLRLQGRCEGAEPGTILIDRQNPLLGEPAVQPLPVAALIQTLAPSSAVLLPATPQTDWLVRHLPVPPTALEAADAAVPRAHLRLGAVKE